MFDIIDFIFDNLFFILLIGGAILNFLGKNKEEQKPNKKKPTIPKPIQEIDWKQIFEKESEPVEPKRAQKVEPIELETEPIVIEEMIASPIEEEQNKLLEKQAELKRLEEKLKQVPTRAMAVKELPIRKTGKSYFQQITKDEVVRGVIWSEVLGKPRAKRPIERIYRQ